MTLPWPTDVERERASIVLAETAVRRDRQQRARTVVEFDALGLSGGWEVEVALGDYRGGMVVCPMPTEVPAARDELRAACLGIVDHAVADRQRNAERVVEELRDRLAAQLRGLGVETDVRGVRFAEARDVATFVNALPAQARDVLWVFDEQTLEINHNRAARFARISLDSLVAATAELYDVAARETGERA